MRVDAGTEALRRVTAGMGSCVAQTTRSAANNKFCAADWSDSVTEGGGRGAALSASEDDEDESEALGGGGGALGFVTSGPAAESRRRRSTSLRCFAHMMRCPSSVSRSRSRASWATRMESCRSLWKCLGRLLTTEAHPRRAQDHLAITKRSRKLQSHTSLS